MTDKTARHYRDHAHVAQHAEEGACRGPTARGSIRSPRSGRRSKSGSGPSRDCSPRRSSTGCGANIRASSSIRIAAPSSGGCGSGGPRHGSGKTVMFRQVHEAGDLAASDFTHMNALDITIARPAVRSPGVPLRADLLELGVGDALCVGVVRGAFRRFAECVLGTGRRAATASQRQPECGGEQSVGDAGVPDPLSRLARRTTACRASGSTSARRTRTAMRSRRTGTSRPPSIRRCCLRGSRDFASREEYVSFLQDVVKVRNAGRGDRFAEELATLREPARCSGCRQLPEGAAAAWTPAA